MTISLKRNLSNSIYFIMLFLLYAVAASQAIWSFSYKWTTIESHPQYPLEKTLEGSLPKPYAYRLLIPKTIRFAVKAIPENFAKPLIKRGRATLWSTIGSNAGHIHDKVVLAYGLILLLGFLLLFCTLLLLRGLAKRLVASSCAGASIIYDISPILFALLLPIIHTVLINCA